MAKKVVSRLKKADAQSVSKVIKMVKSPKTGGLIFKEDVVPTSEANEFFKDKK